MRSNREGIERKVGQIPVAALPGPCNISEKVRVPAGIAPGTRPWVQSRGNSGTSATARLPCPLCRPFLLARADFMLLSRRYCCGATVCTPRYAFHERWIACHAIPYRDFLARGRATTMKKPLDTRSDFKRNTSGTRTTLAERALPWPIAFFLPFPFGISPLNRSENRVTAVFYFAGNFDRAFGQEITRRSEARGIDKIIDSTGT